VQYGEAARESVTAVVLPHSAGGVLRDAARVAAYVHPIVSLAAIAVAVWGASLGLRSRRARPGATVARARHAAIGPWLWAAFVLDWAIGLATVRWGRENVEEAATRHLVVGSAIVALLTAGAILSRRVPTDTRARAIHPLLGGAALLLCALQVFLGLQLLP
jgi:hypothetical protein